MTRSCDCLFTLIQLLIVTLLFKTLVNVLDQADPSYAFEKFLAFLVHGFALALLH